MSDDLVKRLRGDKYTCRENMGCGTMEFCACATMEDAAAHIQAREIERLRDALTNINRKASPDPERTMSEASNDLYWCACEARAALAGDSHDQ